MNVGDQYHHALNALHGSVYFKLLDDAAFFAVNSVVRDVFVLTTVFSIHFFHPVVVGQITATGKLLSGDKTLFTSEAVLEDAAGKLLAKGSGQFCRSKMVLGASIGSL